MTRAPITIRTGSRSFWLASRLLPARIRAPAVALYRFCRDADDAVDTGSDPHGAIALLHARLDAVLSKPQSELSEIDRDFARVLASARIPAALPAALIEGFAWDARQRRYTTAEELIDYARRVAGTVGLMMGAIMGVGRRDMLSAACDLGCAMQLTNVARDVGEDARAGRLYLPLDRLRHHGIDPAALLRDPSFTPALGAVIRELLAEADLLYIRALPAIARLPRSCRIAIRAAAGLYREIGTEIARNGYDSVSSRARVPARRQAGLLLRAAFPFPSSGGLGAPDPRSMFLIDPMPPVRIPTGLLGRIDDGAGRIAALFMRLEISDRSRLAGTRTQR